MLREEFKVWLLSRTTKTSAENRVSNAAKVDKVYDLDKEYAKDKCESLLIRMEYSKEDLNNGVIPQCGITINGNYYTGLQTLRQAVNRYVDFLDETKYGTEIIKKYIPHKKTLKPTFMGDFEDVIKYIGGFTKNKVAYITRKYKASLNKICENCHRPVSQLDAAHISSFDRQTIIKDILEADYKDVNNAGNYIIDMEEFEKKYISAHLPLEDHFYFLCKECHRKYDASPQKLTDAEILSARSKK